MEDISQAKKFAAYKAIEENIKSDMCIGLGSGTTVIYAAEKLGNLMSNGKIKNIRCVPSSYQARQLIIEAGLQLSSLDETPQLEMYIDGADEIDQNFNIIKGGGGCLVKEKIVGFNAKEFIIIADYRKMSEVLGQSWKKGIPIEVIPDAMYPIKQKLESNVIGKGPASVRNSLQVMGPAITENGNFILDWQSSFLNTRDVDWGTLYRTLKLIPGLVDVGLFLQMAHKIYIGYPNGDVITKKITN